MGAVPDAGQPGDLVLAFAALANYATSESFTGLLAPSAACGTTYDASSKIGIFTEPPAPGTAPGVLAIPQPGSSGYLWVMSAPLSVGPQQLEISRGALQAQSAEKGVE
jgi:hypothetical protein